MMNVFSPISDNVLQAANKGATRLLFEIVDRNTLSEEKQGLLYFQFIHIFCLLYEKQKDFSLLKEYLNKCKKYNQIRIPIMDRKHSYYGCFWNTFFTTDLDGEICDVTKVLYNIKTVTNEDKDLYMTFEEIANTLNPVFANVVKKHSFTFVYSQEKIIRMSFSSNISDKYISNLFEKIENIHSVCDKKELEDNVIGFFKDFHVVYKDLIIQEIDITTEELFKHFNLLTDSEETYKKHPWVQEGDCSYILFMVYFSEEEYNDLLLVSSFDKLNCEYKKFYSNMSKGNGMISGFSDHKRSESTNADLFMDMFFFNEYDFFIRNKDIENLEDVIEYLT